jgi:H+-translocating NAD(P) transhydrogenase subunit beta
LRSANKIIIVPGYGMALADAQEEVVQLADRLADTGKTVRFAIHPVAGRMPGHMHVLLAEAGVDYGLIAELKDINGDFSETDLALIVGASDVVNPAALHTTGSPISGMPIFRADEARHVVVCNLDAYPGYSGVENPLYRCTHTIMLLGDAKPTISRLMEGLA